jgi:hypothetical protein
MLVTDHDSTIVYQPCLLSHLLLKILFIISIKCLFLCFQIIPIEASMKENRKNFRKYLHGAILLVSLILGTFGIFGYIHFTHDVKQLISDNLEYGTLSIVVQVTLCVGILFTYPLQMYPVVELAENFFFKETKQRSTLTASFNSEYASLNPDSPRVKYGNGMQVEGGSDDDSSNTEETSENKSAEEMASISKVGLVVPRNGGLCSCDMVSDSNQT